MNPAAPHYVYRCLAADGQLLYVGCTHDIRMRMRYHRHRTPWWLDVFTVATEDYPDRVTALAAERVAIVMERPARNQAYSHWRPPQVEADVRAIEALHHVEGEKPTGLPGQTALSAARTTANKKTHPLLASDRVGLTPMRRS